MARLRVEGLLPDGTSKYLINKEVSEDTTLESLILDKYRTEDEWIITYKFEGEMTMIQKVMFASLTESIFQANPVSTVHQAC